MVPNVKRQNDDERNAQNEKLDENQCSVFYGSHIYTNERKKKKVLRKCEPISRCI